MARKTTLTPGNVCALRSAASIIVADSGTLTDANIPPSAAVDCTGFDSVFVGVEITAGTAPAMTIEALFYDPNAADGARWKRLLLGAEPGVTAGALAAEDSGALDGTKLVELRVFGHSQVFFRVVSVANPTSTTAWTILGMCGRRRGEPRQS